MYDRETLQSALDQLARLQQEHEDIEVPPILRWTLEQMLDRASDRWDDGFHAGLEAGRGA